MWPLYPDLNVNVKIDGDGLVSEKMIIELMQTNKRLSEAA